MIYLHYNINIIMVYFQKQKLSLESWKLKKINGAPTQTQYPCMGRQPVVVTAFKYIQQQYHDKVSQPTGKIGNYNKKCNLPMAVHHLWVRKQCFPSILSQQII